MQFFGNSSWVNISVFITIVVAALLCGLCQKTTFGYELKACGLNKDASAYAGINAKRNIVTSMIIAGAPGPRRRYLLSGRYNPVCSLKSPFSDGL